MFHGVECPLGMVVAEIEAFDILSGVRAYYISFFCLIF